MNPFFKLLAAGAISTACLSGTWTYAQTNAGTSGGAGQLGPCPAPSSSPGAAASPSASPAASASPGTAAQCITVTIPQGAVGMGSAAYGINPLTIPPNTTVTWVNGDTVPHTVTADDQSFDSGTLQPGQSFSHAFSQSGSYPYHCSIHGQASMNGTIQVQASGTASPAPSGSPSASPSPSP